MKVFIPFFSFFPSESPIKGLLKHYELIAEGSKLIPDAFAAYADKKYKAFDELKAKVDTTEESADAVKRKIRNHMPRSLFMPVDKTIFFNFTRSEDDILDAGQDALNWLAINHITIPAALKPQLTEYLGKIIGTIDALKPAIEGTVELVGGGTVDREELKEKCRKVLRLYEKVSAQKRALIAELYAYDIPFKDMYQLLKFIEEMNSSSHNTERCSDMLRAMIAK